MDWAYRLKNRDGLLKKQRAYAAAHREEKRERDRDYRQRNGERLVANNREYYKENRTEILEKQKVYNQLYPEVHLEASRRYVKKNRELQNERNKRSRLKLRREVLDAYGNRCACPACPETLEEFLEAHHLNGGGNQHRKEIGGGAKMYYWLKQHGFPKDFGLLCSNCNKAIYRYGTCPHQAKGLGGITN